MKTELAKTDPAAAFQFAHGSYAHVFDFGPPSTMFRLGADVLAAAYLENAAVLEECAADVLAAEGWLRPRRLRKGFADEVASRSGQSAAGAITGISPVFETYIVEQVSSFAFPQHPTLATTADEVAHLAAISAAYPDDAVTSAVLKARSIEEYGLSVATHALSVEGIAVGDEVHDYFDAIAAWTGVENDYMKAIELASRNVLEDDIREYAAAGISPEYAALLYSID